MFLVVFLSEFFLEVLVGSWIGGFLLLLMADLEEEVNYFEDPPGHLSVFASSGPHRDLRTCRDGWDSLGLSVGFGVSIDGDLSTCRQLSLSGRNT